MTEPKPRKRKAAKKKTTKKSKKTTAKKKAKKKTKKKSPRRKGTHITEYDGYQFEPGASCIIEQYEMLKRCSEKKDMTEWNQWYSANLDVKIHLEGANLRAAELQGANLRLANLQGADLTDANLQGAYLRKANLQGAFLFEAKLQGADLLEAKLQGADLRHAKLQGANLFSANMQSARLWNAKLQDARLFSANLQGAHLLETNLQGADLRNANLQGAHLISAKLQGADLRRAELQGADLTLADLRGADFTMAVDGETIIDRNKINKETDFTGVGLDNARVSPALQQMLKYNIRRRRWREWYAKRAWWKRWPKKAFIQSFWWMSDYGRSTGRIVACFFALAVVFALVYFCWPGCVVGLLDRTAVGDFRAFLHALYFSVVTMTTLGFGDIHANPESPLGQVLLMIQVLLGYILLAALVTRFAVLFQAGGPAGRFHHEKTTWHRLKQRLRVDWNLLCRRLKSGIKRDKD